MPPPLQHPLVILLISTVAVIVLIVRMRMNAFLALIVAATLIGLLSPLIATASLMKEVTGEFGRMAGQIGVAIAMAAIIGECLTESGAADRIVRKFVQFFGEKRASLSLVSSGYVLGIPVFFDTVFYLLVPLARSMSARLGGRNFVLLVLAISAGGSATHVFVPPTPGPLIMAGAIGVDVGLVILVGLAVAIPTSIVGWLYARWIDAKLNVPLRASATTSLETVNEMAARPDAELPGFMVSLIPIVLPVVLIASNTIAQVAAPRSTLAGYTSMLGDPNFSLMLSAAVSLFLLARHRRRTFRELAKTVESSLSGAGMIILITAAGGAFGGMLVKAGVGDALRAVTSHLGVSPLFLAFILASLFKFAQGSATVAMITVSAIVAPLAKGGTLDYHAVYLVMATGAGTLVGQWMNDSGFWVYKTMAGLTEVETLKTKSIMMAVMGCTALAVTWLGSTILPLR